MSESQTQCAALPTTWVCTTLDEVLAGSKGRLTPRADSEALFELYSVPRHSYGIPEIVAEKDIGSGKLTVESGTVMLCRINPRINRAWVVGNHSPHTKIASTEWITFSPLDGLIAEYLRYYLERDGLRDYLASRASGVGGSLMRVKPSTLVGYPLPLAPTVEQRRIAAKLDELFSRLDAAVAQLKETRRRLKSYRQAVLRDAFTGKLTQAWREAQLKDPESPLRKEPASVLLERIREEREKGEGKRKRRKLPPLDTSELSELPEGWAWTTAEQLSDEVRSISYGVVKLGDEIPDGVPVLRTSNVRSLLLDMRNVKRISPAISSRYRRTVLHGGEVLVAVRGTLGGVVRVPPECVGMNVSREVAVIAPADPSAVPVLPALIASPQGQSWLMRNTKGIAYVGVNIETLKQMPIPLPSVAEQHLISAEVERRFSLADAVEQAIAQSLRRAESLRQSILKSAFEGKLVPQDPSDEPAEKLLERIRAEREQRAAEQMAVRKTGGRRRKQMKALPV